MIKMIKMMVLRRPPGELSAGSPPRTAPGPA